MTRSIRRHLRVLQIYTAATLMIAIGMALSAFRERQAAANLGEITAERINIVDRDGTLRLVISNKDRMHPGVVGGKVLQRSRPYAGFLFFNDQGDEAGRMTLTRHADNGRRTAHAGLMVQQLRQRQTDLL